MKYSWRVFKFASLWPIDICTKMVLISYAPYGLDAKVSQRSLKLSWDIPTYCPSTHLLL